MRITDRDVKLVKDIALSHLLSRDQILQLGYFSSVTRVNTRLRSLIGQGLLKRLNTPFFGQSLYMSGPKAPVVLGERIAPIVAARTGSPRFVRHALCVTNARIALVRRGEASWKFEQQLRTDFDFNGKRWEFRPDGLALMPKGPTAVEVDLGHVALTKFRDKLRSYESFVAAGEAKRQLATEDFRLLTITTSNERANRLRRLLVSPHLDQRYATFAELHIPEIGSWS